jgi:hypothetical protein
MSDIDKDADAGVPPNKLVCVHGHIPSACSICELEAETRKHGHLCVWLRDSDGAWYVGCRDMRVLAAYQREVDYNFQKDFGYCPYCGGKLMLT